MNGGSNGTLSADCQHCPVLQATYGSSASFTELCFQFKQWIFQICKRDVNFQPIITEKHGLASRLNWLDFGLSHYAKSRLFGLVAQLGYAALK